MKTKFISLKDFTLSFERLVPSCTCHIEGTIKLSTTYLCFIPLQPLSKNHFDCIPPASNLRSAAEPAASFQEPFLCSNCRCSLSPKTKKDKPRQDTENQESVETFYLLLLAAATRILDAIWSPLHLLCAL